MMNNALINERIWARISQSYIDSADRALGHLP